MGGMPAQPAAGPVGDDVTVAFGGDGRGYVCAARSGHGSNLSLANPGANRAVYVWQTDDGGRSFSAPVILIEGVYSDHPWVAARPPDRTAWCARSATGPPGRTRPGT